jgi:uncharacterized membrane protein YphA (DoxX/SURF4 family)
MRQIQSIIHLPILTLTFRFVLGVIFIYASLDKIQQPADFARVIQNYDMIPVILTNLAAIILPWLELYCGVFLIIGLFLRASAGMIATLMLLFIIAMATALIRGLEIDCGCYGMESQISSGRILEDVGLLIMALYVTFFPGSKAACDNFLNI